MIEVRHLLNTMVIDTNILIYYLKGDSQVTSIMDQWKQERRSLVVSTISVAETLSLSSLTKKQLDNIRDFANNFLSVSVDESLAEKAAYLRRSYDLPIPDACVAATAISKDLPLVTRDTDFQQIKQIEVVDL